MLSIRKKYNVRVGYSDHTTGIEASLGAAALGACMIEKHITLNTKLPGPDHKASIVEKELKQMVEGIRKISEALGDGIKKASLSERKNIKTVRKSIVAKTIIKKGEKFTKKNIKRIRPGYGLSPIYYEKILNKKSSTQIFKGEPIRTQHFHISKRKKYD